MNGGVKAALLVSCLSLAGCATAAKEVKVRAIPDPSAPLARGGNLTALARGQFMIGNIGLALEGFRKAQRAYPTDAAPLAGLGDCYAAMGRFDIAQSNYEAALALAPHDRQLLLSLAAIFDREGKPLNAAAARAEANGAWQVAKPATAIASAPIQAAPIAATATPSSAAKPAPAPVTHAVEIAQGPARQAPAPQPAAAQVSRPAQVPAVAPPPPLQIATVVKPAAPVPQQVATVAKAAAPASQHVAEEVPMPMHASTGSITVELPPARPVDHVEAGVSPPPLPPIKEQRPMLSSVTVELPPARPAPPKAPTRIDPPVAVAESLGPRLERLSRGEVALVTTGKSLWQKPGETRIASTSGLRWVALRSSSDGRPNVQVLNAARKQGIAGSARTVLLNRGWRRIDVGDAPTTRQTSVVLYSRNRAKLGKSLAAQFGVAARMVERDVLVLVLGRDSVDRITGSQKS